jgi:hypothetical protein
MDDHLGTVCSAANFPVNTAIPFAVTLYVINRSGSSFVFVISKDTPIEMADSVDSVIVEDVYRAKGARTPQPNNPAQKMKRMKRSMTLLYQAKGDLERRRLLFVTVLRPSKHSHPQMVAQTSPRPSPCDRHHTEGVANTSCIDSTKQIALLKSTSHTMLQLRFLICALSYKAMLHKQQP